MAASRYRRTAMRSIDDSAESAGRDPASAVEDEAEADGSGDDADGSAELDADADARIGGTATGVDAVGGGLGGWARKARSDRANEAPATTKHKMDMPVSMGMAIERHVLTSCASGAIEGLAWSSISRFAPRPEWSIAPALSRKKIGKSTMARIGCGQKRHWPAWASVGHIRWLHHEVIRITRIS